MVASSEQVESILERQTDSCNPRNSKSTSIVCISLLSIPSYAQRNSVSSVKTLEDAKTAKGCVYFSMPVQEVGTEYQRNIEFSYFSLSMVRCNSESLKRSRRKATSQLWRC